MEMFNGTLIGTFRNTVDDNFDIVYTLAYYITPFNERQQIVRLDEHTVHTLHT